ncbi:unnamed protein product [Rotaria sp. Silwood2]|nr:unnamed protein product [Rotaria sp. Silwood2]CAF4552521.1 unnamed protein product [Rotaria sp. Silwood2]
MCEVCNVSIDEDQYLAHIAICGLQDDNDEDQIALEICALCGKRVQNLRQHFQTCMNEYYTRNDIYEDYSNSPVRPVGQDPTTNVQSQKRTKVCMICSKMIDEVDYFDHINACIDISSARPNNIQECYICSKEIAEVDFITHVNAYASELSSSSKSKLTTRQTQNLCFTCSLPIDSSKISSHTISCPSRHMYCLKCFQHSMNEYIKSNIPPVCHSTLCNYQLSRYDVACLPLESDTIKHLLTCVKSAQRPQCPLCLFYVDFNSISDLENHAALCNSENLIACEYCHCLYNMYRMDDHLQQCRNLSHYQQQQTLIDFIVPRTKYPITSQEIRVFIEHRRKSRLPLDPHSIVDALAVLDGTFPFEIATRDCDVCAETCVYEDIFVFGCTESHKLCYRCFEASCTTKMTNNEILTCPLCNYQLQDGEIRQLRVSADRQKQLLEYQIQKTFSIYTGATQGVIKCPNQQCYWVAEAKDPTDRFQVQCPLCGYEFCSLCNQQYHFRTTCQEVPGITQRWFFWCNTERGNYWQARAQQDANFRAQLEDYERQKVTNERRNEELRQRYNDLLADETFKAQNCRLCPHCRRVVQHLGGCNSMICGQNYHGGDAQSGCGRPFDWSKAAPYVPIASRRPQQVNTKLKAPGEQKLVVHKDVQCDTCHNEVQGIRFDCIHCSSLTFCEKCEQRSTLEHSNQNRDQQKQQHVFRLIPAPIEEKRGIRSILSFFFRK